MQLVSFLYGNVHLKYGKTGAKRILDKDAFLGYHLDIKLIFR